MKRLSTYRTHRRSSTTRNSFELGTNIRKIDNILERIQVAEILTLGEIN